MYRKLGEDWRRERRLTFSVGVDGGLRYDLRLYVPQVDEVKQRLLDEAHRSKYTIHPGSTKMYKDLKSNFW